MRPSRSSAKPDRQGLVCQFAGHWETSPLPSGQGLMEVRIVNTPMTGHIRASAHLLSFGGANVRKVVNPREAQKDTCEPRK